MFKNILKKSTVAALALSTILAGVSIAPHAAQAHSNIGFNTMGEIKKGEKVEFKHNTGFGLGLGNIDLDIDSTVSGQNNSSIKEIIKPAQTTLKQSIKTAKTDFKDAKKEAKAELQASVNANTSQPDRIAAIKTYFTGLLTALKAKNTAIETAISTFINTTFNTNHAPVANAKTVTVAKNSTVNITLTGSDFEGSVLTYSVVSGPTHGTLSGTGSSLIYTPTANFTGTDSFTFKVNDGSLNSTSNATVSITVTP